MNLADCYRILGLRTGASYEDIKASYRRLARQYHPDVNPDRQQQAKEKFIQITEAYQQLVAAVAPSDAKNGRQGSREGRSSRRTPQRTAPAAEQNPARAKSPPARQPASSPPRQPVAATKPRQPETTAAVTPPAKKPAVQKSPDATPNEQQLKENSYEQLQQLLKEQRFPRAIALVEGLAQRLPADNEVRQWQAIAYQLWGRYLVDTNEPDKARLYLKKALRTDPRNKSLWYEVERDLRRIEQLEVL